MNFRLVATVPKQSPTGQIYNHMIWMGEFNGAEFSEWEAIEFAREKVGDVCAINSESIPFVLH